MFRFRLLCVLACLTTVNALSTLAQSLSAQPPQDAVGPTLGSPWSATPQRNPSFRIAQNAPAAEPPQTSENQPEPTPQEPIQEAVAQEKKDSRELELQKQLEVVQAQQAAAEERTTQLALESQGVLAELEKTQTEGIDDSPPYSFLLLDSFRDSLTTQAELVKSLEETEESSFATLNSAKESAAQRKNQLVNAKEALAEAKDPAKKPALNLAFKLASLESQIAAAQVELRSTERSNAKLTQKIEEQRLDLLKAKIALVEPETVFSEEDLDTRLLELSNLEDSLTRERQATVLSTNILVQKWDEARSNLRAGQGNAAALEAEVRARKQERDAASDKIELLNQQLSWLAEAKEAWQRRYRVALNNYSRKDLTQWLDDSEEVLSEMKSNRQRMESRLQEIRRQLSEVAREIQSVQQADNPALTWMNDRQATLRAQSDTISDHFGRMESVERVTQKLTDEIDQRQMTFDLGEWSTAVWEQIRGVWNYILVPDPAGGEALAIRVKTVVKGFFYLAIGIWISRRLSYWLGKRILPRFGVHEGAASALQSLAFYAFVLTSLLMALSYVQVPLTVFTFLGGAVAIGLGFGSQNILNNFISGIILLVEQPVRVGDLVELLGLTGTVEHIGMRSTRIRTPQNQEMIVPNSSFLENNVQNWTLSDSTIRCHVDVGVAYGSPTRYVARWMRQAAEKHGMVRQKPEPFVWFTGFGDNSLNFELHFFIVIRTIAERRRIESDLRFMIDQNFRDAGIVIAFPQRDMHLDTQSPLEIRMMPPREAPDDEEEKPSKIGSPDSKATKPTGMTPMQVKASQAKLAKEKKEEKEAQESREKGETD